MSPESKKPIIAPCISSGEVRESWPTDPDGGPPGYYNIIDNDSKDAECRCPNGACCVDGKNHVIFGISQVMEITETLES